MEILKKFFTLVATTILVVVLGCNKLVQVPAPVTSITAGKTFASDADADAAISAIYSDMFTGHNTNVPPLAYANGGLTIMGGIAADELIDHSNIYPDFQTNTILTTGILLGQFWQPAYYDIYMCNSAIENLSVSTTVSATVKKELIGEAEFLRAYAYFYLVNFFGDVPLVTVTAWQQISALSRTSSALVYKQIVTDLLNAQAALPPGYSVGKGERIRANYWAATALLARVYLYLKDYTDAENQSSAVINSSNFSLLSDLTTVFLKNSNEAILQLKVVDNYNYYTTIEGHNILPLFAFATPSFTLTGQLLGAFEPGDLRKSAWVKTSNVFGKAYSYPFKYTVRSGTSGNVTQYTMLLRLAEQYLIRAEAEANGASGGISAAINDLNKIRSRAGLQPLSSTLTTNQVISAVAQERRIELFAEFGHRWLDLVRTEQAINVLSLIKPGFNANDELWPIPLTEIQKDPELKQNPGY